MIKSIQILRAIAAMLVVFLHFEFRGIKIGTFGVDIFFIISGFIITFIINRDSNSFLYRRVVRIVPLYFSMTVLITVVALIRPEWFRSIVVTGEAFIKSILFIPYRIQNSGPLLSLGWTLNYEMFFYLVTALGISLLGGKRGIVISLALLLLFTQFGVLCFGNSYIVNFLSNNIIIEFILGSLLYSFWNYYRKNGLLRYKSPMIVVGLLSLAFMIYADLYINIDRFLKFGIPSLLLANSFLLLEDKINLNNRGHRLFILLGDSSYAMYLVHPFIIYFFIRLVFKHFQTDNLLIVLSELIFTLIVVGGISIIIHLRFEKPLIGIVRRIFDKRLDKRKGAI